MTKRGSKNTKRVSRPKTPDQIFEAQTQGDIPRHRRFDQVTRSVAEPRVSTNYSIRQVLNTKVITQASGAQYLTYAFTFADLDNSPDFAPVWDQYRFEAVSLAIRPVNNAIGLTTPGTVTLADMYVVIDYDDDSALLSTAAARQYDNCMTLTPTESGYRIFRPRMAVAAYQGAFTGYANTESMWIDMNSTGVRHYGVKLAVGGSAASQTLLQQWELEFTYYLSFRSVK